MPLQRDLIATLDSINDPFKLKRVLSRLNPALLRALHPDLLRLLKVHVSDEDEHHVPIPLRTILRSTPAGCEGQHVDRVVLVPRSLDGDDRVLCYLIIVLDDLFTRIQQQHQEQQQQEEEEEEANEGEMTEAQTRRRRRRRRRSRRTRVHTVVIVSATATATTRQRMDAVAGWIREVIEGARGHLPRLPAVCAVRGEDEARAVFAHASQPEVLVVSSPEVLRRLVVRMRRHDDEDDADDDADDGADARKDGEERRRKRRREKKKSEERLFSDHLRWLVVDDAQKITKAIEFREYTRLCEMLRGRPAEGEVRRWRAICLYPELDNRALDSPTSWRIQAAFLCGLADPPNFTRTAMIGS